MSRVEWQGQVRWSGEKWQRTKTFTEEPSAADLRSASWNIIGLRSKGSEKPIQVRCVKVTYEPRRPAAFEVSK